MALPPLSTAKYSDIELEVFKKHVFHDRTITGTMKPPPSMLEMISMRMKWGNGPVPFAFLAAHKMNDERVVVFIVHKEQAVMVEDDWNLFPSDALITKLRLILG